MLDIGGYQTMKWNNKNPLHLILIILSAFIIIPPNPISKAAEVTTDSAKAPTFLFLLLEGSDCDGMVQSCYTGKSGTNTNPARNGSIIRQQ